MTSRKLFRLRLDRLRPALARLRPAATGVLPALRGLFPALWLRAAGRTPEGSRPTAAFLRRRMLVLPALAVVALALSAAAYGDVHGRTERLRDRCAPALVDLAQARVSLELAQAQAELRLKTAEQAGSVELGETYRSLLTEASQSLNRVAQSRALHKAQQQELRVVSGLVVAYGDKIAWADRNRLSKVLREAGVDYADDMLRGKHLTVAQATPRSPSPSSTASRSWSTNCTRRTATWRPGARSPWPRQPPRHSPPPSSPSSSSAPRSSCGTGCG
ncbi:hypothetical protein [Streptomyces sp. V1I1]|uniref:hypothetical protein n=1 Tax=Streptomyces sp. V1I1 TaxID=3042272 RepID=UPI002787DB27|nr:hypothetical protein [Streptomyces sp. V1I1]MDQ0942664.1 hypothetical protein [Streptomyces sp. V1I1]